MGLLGGSLPRPPAPLLFSQAALPELLGASLSCPLPLLFSARSVTLTSPPSAVPPGRIARPALDGETLPLGGIQGMDISVDAVRTSGSRTLGVNPQGWKSSTPL